jgi:Na+-driven multidrug efflux pump
VYQALQIRNVLSKQLLPPPSELLSKPPRREELALLGSYIGPLSFVVFTRVFGFSLMNGFAGGLGTAALAAHQITFAVFSFFAVFGECLSQTAQTMLPKVLASASRVAEARSLINRLLLAG